MYDGRIVIFEGVVVYYVSGVIFSILIKLWLWLEIRR